MREAPFGGKNIKVKNNNLLKVEGVQFHTIVSIKTGRSNVLIKIIGILFF